VAVSQAAVNQGISQETLEKLLSRVSEQHGENFAQRLLDRLVVSGGPPPGPPPSGGVARETQSTPETRSTGAGPDEARGPCRKWPASSSRPAKRAVPSGRVPQAAPPVPSFLRGGGREPMPPILAGSGQPPPPDPPSGRVPSGRVPQAAAPVPSFLRGGGSGSSGSGGSGGSGSGAGSGGSGPPPSPPPARRGRSSSPDFEMIDAGQPPATAATVLWQQHESDHRDGPAHGPTRNPPDAATPARRRTANPHVHRARTATTAWGLRSTATWLRPHTCDSGCAGRTNARHRPHG
jgi:hypothetical protein